MERQRARPVRCIATRLRFVMCEDDLVVYNRIRRCVASPRVFST